MAEKYAVGVDFGGTKISAGVVNLETGRLVGAAKKKTRQVSEQDDVVKRIISVVDESMSTAGVDLKKIHGIGVGAAGMVNRQKGILLDAVNIGANDLPLAEPLSKYYSVPCKLGNDVEVAALGEMHFGAGKGCRDLVCIFVGTGIGSGIVRDGKLYRGFTGTAGEIGHIVLFPDGRQCACGAFGCLEAYASRTAVAKTIVMDLNKGMDSVIRDKVDMTKGILRSKALAHAVQSGDELVLRAVHEAAHYMGMGLATVINFYNPQRIIMGGGLIEAVEMYFHVAVKEGKRRALKIPARKLDIVKAALGDYAGIVGAAMLMREMAPAAEGQGLARGDSAHLHILVINSGSSSIKAGLFNIDSAAQHDAVEPLWQATVDLHEGKIKIESQGETHEDRALSESEGDNAVQSLLTSIWQGPAAVVSSKKDIDAVGHRIVHGGPKYSSSVLIDDDVKKNIKECVEFAPLHNAANLRGIEAVEKMLAGVPQVAVFDTAFHHNMPESSSTYAIPFQLSERYHIRRYGFHGISHQYCAARAAQILNRDTSDFHVIVCHLGNGCSIAAVRNGTSIDTTMGFTPLDGLVMGTRCGAVDPGILLYLLEKEAHTHDELDDILDRQSGLLGISGTSSDMREILRARDKGDKRAALAYDVFVHSLTGYIGTMLARLDGADAIVFTAGIGENVPELRSAACRSLSYAGVGLDEKANREFDNGDADIALATSKTRVLVIHTQETWAIARETWRVLTPSQAE